MNIFERRVRAAAIAGWWLALIALGFVTVQWVACLAVVHARPAWVLSLWGPNIDWSFVQVVWFWGIVVMKLLMWLVVLIALWLTLWARQLRRDAIAA